MTRHAAIGIDDDLAARKARVTHRSTDLESTCWVDEKTEITRVEIHRLQNRLDDEPANIWRQGRLEIDFFRVL
jgi:hypothetical protein